MFSIYEQEFAQIRKRYVGSCRLKTMADISISNLWISGRKSLHFCLPQHIYLSTELLYYFKRLNNNIYIWYICFSLLRFKVPMTSSCFSIIYWLNSKLVVLSDICWKSSRNWGAENESKSKNINKLGRKFHLRKVSTYSKCVFVVPLLIPWYFELCIQHNRVKMMRASNNKGLIEIHILDICVHIFSN